MAVPWLRHTIECRRDGVLILLFMATASLAQTFPGRSGGGALDMTTVALSIIPPSAQSCAHSQAGRDVWAGCLPAARPAASAHN